MGIVRNEQNIPVGLISIEDILEKLVGKIFDEDDNLPNKPGTDGRKLPFKPGTNGK